MEDIGEQNSTRAISTTVASLINERPSYMETKVMGKAKNLYSFSFNRNFKASKQGKRASDLHVHEFGEDAAICPVRTLDAYMEMTKPWRDKKGETQL